MNEQSKTILTLQLIIKAIRSLARMVTQRLRRKRNPGLGRKKRRKKHVRNDDA